MKPKYLQQFAQRKAQKNKIFWLKAFFHFILHHKIHIPDEQVRGKKGHITNFIVNQTLKLIESKTAM